MSNFVPAFPDEIATDIITRLPAKSIGKSKCVSRSWRKLLSSPNFIRKHLSHHIHDKEQLFLFHLYYYLYTLTFNNNNTCSEGVFKKLNLSLLKDNMFRFGIVGSCNGLVCVADWDQTNKYLINPTTCEYVKLLDSFEATDPQTSSYMHGFGYDNVNDDYKIVSTASYGMVNKDDPNYDVGFIGVYSAKMGSWKRIGRSPYSQVYVGVDYWKFLNGVLHFLARRTIHESFIIAAFNLTTEAFEELPLPAMVEKHFSLVDSLIILGGCICFLEDFNPTSDDLVIWMMKEYGMKESWTKLIIHNISRPSCSKPLYMLRDEEIVILVNFERLIVHNLKENTLKDLVTDGAPEDLTMLFDGVTFRESLVSPNFNNRINNS